MGASHERIRDANIVVDSNDIYVTVKKNGVSRQYLDSEKIIDKHWFGTNGIKLDGLEKLVKDRDIFKENKLSVGIVDNLNANKSFMKFCENFGIKKCTENSMFDLISLIVEKFREEKKN